VAGASGRTQGTTSTIGVNRVQRMTIGSNSLFDRVRRNGAYAPSCRYLSEEILGRSCPKQAI
jgi:hypothetical protein